MEHMFESDDGDRFGRSEPPTVDSVPNAMPDHPPGVDESTVGGNAVLFGAGDEMAAAAIARTVVIRQQMGALQAQELHELATLAVWVRAGNTELYGCDPSIAHRSLVADLAAAHRVSDRTMGRRIADAERFVTDYPAAVAALEDGRIDLGHMRVIADHGLPIQDDTARAVYEQVVLDKAVDTTPGRLGRYAQRAAATCGEVTFQQRYDQAYTQRRVWVQDIGDGLSELGMTVPTVLAEGILDRLTQQAKAITGAAGPRTLDPDNGDLVTGEPRSYDQLRTDLACELLLTGQPTGCEDAPHHAGIGIRAEIAVVIPALTLLHTDPGADTGGDGGGSTGTGTGTGTGPHTDAGAGTGTGTGTRPGKVPLEPPTLAGKGPIDPATARRLAADAPRLTRLLTHPVTGMALTADTYRPSAKLRRFLRLRDGRCRQPGCIRSAGRCDIDHTIPAEVGGPTVPDNLAHLCRGHHTLKHHGGWGVKQVSPGVLEWTPPPAGSSPTSQTPGPPSPKADCASPKADFTES
ncbi:HNH endonuclease signature motif containing protein [Homoserinimonas sp. OAct 916]|uniref:HNH endonuclease signature motif containing protein n=1 Tax=Homoserinimonas sp. OAct 916 TaxID=2211450 RepID=UPI000DBE648E|nr:HNH endonuclease signature motif containing protein [Homoserinimonas sp. OAct 916]